MGYLQKNIRKYKLPYLQIKTLASYPPKTGSLTSITNKLTGYYNSL